MRRERGEAAMNGVGATGLEAVQLLLAAIKTWRRLTVNLTAGLWRFIQHDGPQAMFEQGLRSAHAGRTGADDQGSKLAHAASPMSVSKCMPSRMKLEQARSFSPLTVCTQQSWQAPIMQKPARGWPLNSLRRSWPTLSRIAVNTVSPSSAVAGR